MKFFVDTAEINAIKEFAATSLLDGVTTNPTLIMKSGGTHEDVIAEICQLVGARPVSAEVISTDIEPMFNEGKQLAGIASNVVVKVPLTWNGLRVCENLSREGIPVNVTLCFNANQALLAAKAGAAYISPFIGRLDDIGLDGIDLISDIREIYDNYGFTTQLLAASVRSPHHVTQCALAGADVATVPPSVLRKLCDHPLTDIGLASFLADAARARPA
ncbi:MAG: fructose-6-phosphate aldolase [Rhodobacteraceae bacterium]|nr:fructose-6-phosphate aldolase [Paracoccaceae bacterium]MCY4196325.1 fructose-6-phosphate aldolase [Paracoccaceae bacterium]MCY4327519.1 fructose-6-phosphate aldolase [Paracoccaceae bacterium]